MQTERLAQRLAYLCACEGLRCEKSTLRTLAEMAECDVRSCLNTLQVAPERGWGKGSGGKAKGMRLQHPHAQPDKTRTGGF